GGVAEGELAAIAAEDVPRLPEQRRVERHDDDVEPEVGPDRERRDADQQEDREEDEEAAHRGHALCPRRPVGRKMSTRMKIRKMPIWPRLSPRNSPPIA